MVVPCVWYLKDELKIMSIDSSIPCFLKNKCSAILEQKIELQDIHFSAAMLNPSYRSLRQATNEEQSRTQKYLRKRLECTPELRGMRDEKICKPSRTGWDGKRGGGMRDGTGSD